MDDIITLIGVTTSRTDYGAPTETETRTDVWAHIRSVGRAEWAAAGDRGMQPSLIFETPIVNYSGQSMIDYAGARYTIYRTYRVDDSDILELYAERKAGQANPTGVVS